MATTIGSTGSSGSPCIRIKISGAFTSKTQEFEVTVDTGFTGFISMPIMSALPLGLPLYGTTSVQFGDGKTATRFTALGVAELGNESEAGVVILEPSTSTILVGMEFLSAFKKTVFLHRGVLVLLDQSEMDKTLPPDVVEAIRQMASPVEAPTKPKEEPPPAKAPPPTQN